MQNAQFSGKDFTDADLRSTPAADFAGEIVGSCFYQQKGPGTPVFPDDAEAVFVRCNLDNVLIPPGCVVGEGCTAKRIKVDEYGVDWIVDADNLPIEPLSEIVEVIGEDGQPV